MVGHKLFSDFDLGADIQARCGHIDGHINSISEEQLQNTADDKLVNDVVNQLSIEPLILHQEHQDMNQCETYFDISNDPEKLSDTPQQGPHYVYGTQIKIDIPFTGKRDLFWHKPEQCSSSFPRAEVMDCGVLRLIIRKPANTMPDTFKLEFDRQMKLIRDYVGWSKSQIDSYNSDLPNLIREAISRRRKHLANHGNLSEVLNIPIAVKPDVPSATPVKPESRSLRTLPEPPNTELKPEPGISNEEYETILHYIRHQCRTFEQKPGTFAVHGEEDLRNIVLAQLNGHSEGSAVGEAFRGKGKTDICIEARDRSAFVGECKVWAGKDSLIKALDQLLSYLTWRDSKAAVIVFNTKNRGFTKIRQRILGILRSHPSFWCKCPCDEEGEWRIQMHSQEDEEKRVTVHVFIFNLYHIGKPKNLSES